MKKISNLSGALLKAAKACLHEFDRCTIFDANGTPFMKLKEIITEIESRQRSTRSRSQ